MAEDRVTLTADGTQYFDVLSRAGVAADRLSQSGDRIGTGFLRGDRVVRTATANITQGLLTANSAADAAIITFQSLERVFRIPIGATIGVAAGVAVFAEITKEVNKTKAAFAAARDELTRPLNIEINLDPSDIVQRMEAVKKASDDLVKNRDSFFQKIMRFIAGGSIGDLGGTFPAGPGASAHLLDKFNEKIGELDERERALAGARADKELQIARLKEVETDVGKEAADIAKAQLDYETQRAKLADEYISKGGNMLYFYKRLLAAQFSLNAAIGKGVDALGEMAEKAMLKLGKATNDFFLRVGSGQFIKDFNRQQMEERQRESAKQTFAELQAAAEAGIPLGPAAQAMLREGSNLANAAGVGVGDLAKLDFSNLEELTKYDFTGLEALSGLTISIQ